MHSGTQGDHVRIARPVHHCELRTCQGGGAPQEADQAALTVDGLPAVHSVGNGVDGSAQYRQAAQRHEGDGGVVSVIEVQACVLPADGHLAPEIDGAVQSIGLKGAAGDVSLPAGHNLQAHCPIPVPLVGGIGGAADSYSAAGLGEGGPLLYKDGLGIIYILKDQLTAGDANLAAGVDAEQLAILFPTVFAVKAYLAALHRQGRLVDQGKEAVLRFVLPGCNIQRTAIRHSDGGMIERFLDEIRDIEIEWKHYMQGLIYYLMKGDAISAKIEFEKAACKEIRAKLWLAFLQNQRDQIFQILDEERPGINTIPNELEKYSPPTYYDRDIKKLADMLYYTGPTPY